MSRREAEWRKRKREREERGRVEKSVRTKEDAVEHIGGLLPRVRVCAPFDVYVRDHWLDKEERGEILVRRREDVAYMIVGAGCEEGTAQRR